MGVNGIYGLSGSGLDIESMVKVGMMSKQNEYDKMYKKETKMEWQKEAYSGVYTDLTNFSVNKLTDYKLQSKMNAMSATSNNTGAVSVSANGSAVAMSHRVEVNELSSNAYLMSTEAITRSNTSASSDSMLLKDVMFQSLALNGSGTYGVTYADGTTATVNETDVALSFVVDDGATTEEAAKRTVSFTYGDLAGGVLSDGTTGNAKTLNDLASAIKKLGLNVTASYDSVNDSFSLYNSKGGEDNKISLTMGTQGAADLFNHLNLGQSNSDELTPLADDFFTYDASAASQTASEVTGTNGSVKIDGRTYSNITDNRITVAGVTYTLLDKTSSAATVTVTQDQDAIIDRVKQFVEDYNTMLDSLQDKYNEQKYSDYDVLTKSQEESMTKEQVEKWNEKAKSGLLYHNKFLGDIISKMREALATPVDGVEGKYNSAFNIGIRTSTDRGHIELDEEKLKTALNAEPTSVYQVFGKLGDYDEKTGQYDFKGSGVAQRLGDVINDGMKKIKAEAGTSTEASDGSSLGNKILEWQNKMSDFKVKMSTFETLLYKKYDAMEVALQKLSMTLNYVTGGNG